MPGQSESNLGLPTSDGLAAGDVDSDRQIAQAREGSEPALGILLERCRNYLQLIANQEVPSDIRPKVAPSDLVQQSLAEAWQGFETFRGQDESELRRWLRRILLNNVRDTTVAFRGTAKRGGAREIPLASEGSQDGFGQQLVSDDTSPSGCAAQREDMARLAAKLDQMPSQYAEIIRLRNIDCLSFAEIGQRLTLKPDTARKLWERAVRRLANDLRPGNDQS